MNMPATPSDLQATIEELWVYPVKSCAGVRLPEAELTDTGLLYDRAWMVVDAQGHFVSQRELPRMALIQPSFRMGQLVIKAPGMLALHLALDAAESPARVQVWDDVNISATGDVAVNSAGDVVLTAAGDLRVRDLNDLEISGITAGGRMRLEAAGSILTQGSDNRIDTVGGVAVLRSAGDMLLVASGTAGVTGGVIRSNAGTLSINVGAYGQKLPGNDGWREGTLTLRAAGDVDVTEWTDDI